MATPTTPKSATTKESGDLGAETQDLATGAENARIQANQDRYDARVSGKSSAELNEEARKQRDEKREKPEVAKGGGQTLPAHEATGEPADGAVAAEVPEAPASTSSTTSSSSTSSDKG